MSFKKKAELAIQFPESYRWLRLSRHISGWLTDQEANRLFLLARHATPEQSTIVVEIGSWQGKSSVMLGGGVLAKPDARLYCVDPFGKDESIEDQQRYYDPLVAGMRRSLGEAFECNIRRSGLSAVTFPLRGYSFEIVEEWQQPIDLLFIDANHRYESVRRDFEQWAPFVKIGGVIALHDVSSAWPGPTRVRDELLQPPNFSRFSQVDTLAWATKTGKLQGSGNTPEHNQQKALRGFDPQDSGRYPAGDRRSSISISAVVLTKNGASRIGECLHSIAQTGIADEIVVCIDSETTDQSYDAALPFTQQIEIVKTKGNLESALPQMASFCSGNYILRIDDDERIRGVWDKRAFEALTCLNDATHFFLPRRWLIPPGNLFIASEPWFPDLQMRLFRNDSRLISWPTRVHDDTRVKGRHIVFWDRWIDHLNLQTSRIERERKCERYRTLRPDHDLSHFYLYEEQNFETLSVDEEGFRTALEKAVCRKSVSTVGKLRYLPGQWVDFRDCGNSSHFTLGGWSHNEAWGTWTEGFEAEICLALERTLEGAAVFSAVVRAFVNTRHPVVRAQVEYRGQVLAEWIFDGSESSERSIPIPVGAMKNDTAPKFCFRILNPASPSELGLSSDQRLLGLGFVSLRLGSGPG
jgi:MMP 1-O-methyltransferase